MTPDSVEDVVADAVSERPDKPKGGAKPKRHNPSREALAQGTAERLRLKKPTMVKCPVVLDGILADALADARQRFEIADTRLRARPDDHERDVEFTAAKRAVEDLEKRAADATVDVWFQSIGSVAWEELRDDHPLSDKTRERLAAEGISPREMPITDTATFPPEAIAASAVDVEIDEQGNVTALGPLWDIAEVRRMYKDPMWNDGELQALYFTAVAANQVRKTAGDLPKD